MFERLRFLPAALVLVVASFPAQSADDIKPPPPDYRQWFHVNTMIVDKDSPLFKDLGGMHNVYVNAVGLPGLKKGGPYPDKSMFVTDLHDFMITDGSYVEGARKGVAVMVKDSKKFASTGGWGFQFFAGSDPKTAKPIVTDPAKMCYACHEPKKDQGYVYSTYLP
jgi:cytochrome P460